MAIWDGDTPDYIAACQRASERWVLGAGCWVLTPVSPSAEQYSRLLFILVDR